MSRGGRRGTRKLREARPEHLPPKPRANAKTKLCKYHVLGNCANGAACDFAHGAAELQASELCRGPLEPPAHPVPGRHFPQPMAPELEKSSGAPAYDADDLSTCLSDGEGSSSGSSHDFFSRQSTTESHPAAEDAQGFHARQRLYCPGVMVKNTFLHFGSIGSSSSTRRARSAT